MLKVLVTTHEYVTYKLPITKENLSIAHLNVNVIMSLQRKNAIDKNILFVITEQKVSIHKMLNFKKY